MHDRTHRHLPILLASLFVLLGPAGGLPAAASPQPWLAKSIIYCVNPEIFSTDGIAGVTAQLGRLRKLGVGIVWLMPIFPRGRACTVAGVAHPSFDSPYCVSNMTGIDPAMGSAADLHRLVDRAHTLGMHVLLDVALNQTAWDNPLVTKHPQMYLHTGSDLSNPATIRDGWGMFGDVAQLNCATNQYGTQSYLTGVCTYWLRTFHFDGFRIDSADNPSGPSRSLPQSFMIDLNKRLQAIDPNVVLLGEEGDRALALAPYDMDYGWRVYYALARAMAGKSPASSVEDAWRSETTGWPPAMLHMSMTQDWDMPLDIAAFGGAAGAKAAAVFDFTMPGVPLIYNGQEVGNERSGNNTHAPIDWTGPNRAAFWPFYLRLAALRRANPALQQGRITWLKTNDPGQVLAYERSLAGKRFIVEIDIGTTAIDASFVNAMGGKWRDITPAASPAGRRAAPGEGKITLPAWGFAVFEQTGS